MSGSPRWTASPRDTEEDARCRLTRGHPSLDVDIRTSLILPALSQRFSVLLPALLSVPEPHMRTLFASQRARQDGPSLTLEEEDMVLAHLRHGNGTLDDRDGHVVTSPSAGMGSSTPPSSASPSAAMALAIPSWPTRPHTATGQSSDATMETIGAADQTATATATAPDLASYGDSIWAMQQSTSGPVLDEGPSSTASERALHQRIPASPPPTSAASDSSTPTHHSLSPAPLAAPTAGANRGSLLASLTPAQVKRISMALEELKGTVSRHQRHPSAELRPQPSAMDAQETLQSDTAPSNERQGSISGASTHSAPFPFSDSPARPQQQQQPSSAAPSPSKMSPSPKSYNLHAHIAPAPIEIKPFRVDPSSRPILTPSRTRPVRHKPTASVSSSGQHSPVYIPGQPRPVGSALRSEGSVSSPFAPSSSPSPAAGSYPLSRSLSVSQSATKSRPPVSSHFRAQSLNSFEPSRVLAFTSRASGIIEEDEDADEHGMDSDPEIKSVEGRRNIDNGFLSIHSDRSTKAISQQAVIEGTDMDQYLGGTSSPPLRRHSSDSVASDFAGNAETKWDSVFDSRASRVHEVDDQARAADLLRQLSGMDVDDVTVLQTRLVENARLERLALRQGLDQSPEMQTTPTFAQTPTLSQTGHLAHTPVLAPSPSLRQTPTLSQSRKLAQSPDLGQASGLWQSPSLQQSPALGQSPQMESIQSSPAIPGPSTPKEPHGDSTVPFEGQAPPASTNGGPPGTKEAKVAPADDPDVRRDFEARIAAATAALKRTPTVSGSIQRRNTKKGAPMIISSPTLVSSSAKLDGTPLSPPSEPNASVAKALEKTSGSGSKMASRWRKLGFRRGPSVSSNEVFTPPPPASASLAGPIELRPSPPPVDPPHSAPPQTSSPVPNLNTFRFPNGKNADPTLQSTPLSSPAPAALVARSQSTKVETGMRKVSARRRGRSDNVIPESSTTESSSTVVEALDDDAVAKFLEAGRAIGLSETQMKEMLAAKGMKYPDHQTAPLPANGATPTPPGSVLKPASISLSVSRSNPNSAPAVAPGVTFGDDTPTPTLAASNPQHSYEKKTATGAMGLLRSLSRSQKAKPRPSHEKEAEEEVPRNVIVRRTLLLPQDVSVTPSPRPRSKEFSVSPSPNAAAGGRGEQRKLSVRRKPLNLTREDQELVQRSPPTHLRKVSLASSIQSQDSTPGTNPGLGLGVPPLNTLSRARPGSSISEAASEGSAGSLYDLYRGNTEDIAISPQPPRVDPKRATQAVEITEYSDGKMVWNVVDALRAEEEQSVYSETSASAYPQPGSRSVSMESERSRDDDVFSSGTTAGLNLRHRDRLEKGLRPATNVYYTSPADVADLIDRLSHDDGASKGRIVLPTRSPDRRRNLYSGQFEDAPSPISKLAAPPRRQLCTPQTHDVLGSLRNLPPAQGSPSAPSFSSAASADSAPPGATVEDRLQALLDRLHSSGVRPG